VRHIILISSNLLFVGFLQLSQMFSMRCNIIYTRLFLCTTSRTSYFQKPYFPRQFTTDPFPDLFFNVILYPFNIHFNITSILWSNLGLPRDPICLGYQTNTSMHSYSLILLRNSEKQEFCFILVNSVSAPKTLPYTRTSLCTPMPRDVSFGQYSTVRW